MPSVSPVVASEVLLFGVVIATEFQRLSAASVIDARLLTLTVLLIR
jgi:hypothetical protein